MWRDIEMVSIALEKILGNISVSFYTVLPTKLFCSLMIWAMSVRIVSNWMNNCFTLVILIRLPLAWRYSLSHHTWCSSTRILQEIYSNTIVLIQQKYSVSFLIILDFLISDKVWIYLGVSYCINSNYWFYKQKDMKRIWRVKYLSRQENLL